MSTYPADAWEPSGASGTAWNTHVFQIDYGTLDPYSGAYSIKTIGGDTSDGRGVVTTEYAQVLAGKTYRASCFFQVNDATNASAKVIWNWYDSAFNFFSFGSTTFSTWAAADAWTHRTAYAKAPAGAVFLRVVVVNISPSSADFIYIDSAEIERTPVSFSAKKAAAQAGLATGAYTALTFDSEDHDIGTCFASNAFVAPENGVYHLDGQFGVDDVTTTALVVGSLYKDTGGGYGLLQEGNYAINGRGATSDITSKVSKVVPLNAGDAVKMYGYHNHGSDRSTVETLTYFSGCQIL